MIAILLLCAVSLFAQAPEKFTYQAVVRNANNSLVTNVQVGVRVSILQGSASGTADYVEVHTATTNANGLSLSSSATERCSRAPSPTSTGQTVLPFLRCLLT